MKQALEGVRHGQKTRKKIDRRKTEGQESRKEKWNTGEEMTEGCDRKRGDEKLNRNRRTEDGESKQRTEGENSRETHDRERHTRREHLDGGREKKRGEGRDGDGHGKERRKRRETVV